VLEQVLGFGLGLGPIWRNGGWGVGVGWDGGEEVMMWQLVNMYKHVCLCAEHAGTGKFIKNVVY
jgi:hypothetical protein